MGVIFEEAWYNEDMTNREERSMILELILYVGSHLVPVSRKQILTHAKFRGRILGQGDRWQRCWSQYLNSAATFGHVDPHDCPTSSYRTSGWERRPVYLRRPAKGMYSLSTKGAAAYAAEYGFSSTNVFVDPEEVRWGHAGISKTGIALQQAKERGIPVVTIGGWCEDRRHEAWMCCGETEGSSVRTIDRRPHPGMEWET